jgi:hypothetical protein
LTGRGRKSSVQLNGSGSSLGVLPYALSNVSFLDIQYPPGECLLYMITSMLSTTIWP